MKRLFSMIPALLLFCMVQAQTVDEVVSKHFEATGGIDKWRGAETVYMEGIAVMQNGNEITSKISKVKDKVLRREIDFGMGSMTMIVTPTKGWYTNPRSGGEFQDMPEQMLKNQLGEMEIHPLLDADKKGNKLELVGKETIDGMETYKIKLTPTSGQEQFYFIDAKTFNLVRMTTKVMGGGGRRPAPASSPRHAACATPTTPGPVNSTGAQSAVCTATTAPGRAVTAASASSPACSPGSLTVMTRAP